MILFFGNI